MMKTNEKFIEILRDKWYDDCLKYNIPVSPSEIQDIVEELFELKNEKEIYDIKTENKLKDKEKFTMNTNEINMNIYVTDEQVADCFDVVRSQIWDNDLYDNKCDSIEMSDHDIDIAFIKKGNIQYTLFTSCDRWNVYLIKEQCNEYNVWQSQECNNITHDIDNWENVQGLMNYLLELDFEEKSQQVNIIDFLETKIRNDEAVLSDAYWLDTITFYVQFNLSSDELKKYFHNMIDDEDGDYYLSAEYHEDEHKFVYELIFDENKFNMDKNIQSTIIDWYILEQARSF